MRRIRRQLRSTAALALAVVLGVGGCGWVGSDDEPAANPGSRGNGGGGVVVEGRPWRRGRRRRSRVARARWTRRPTVLALVVAGLTKDESQALARAWARAGEFEHASIHAFTDLAAHLRSHGAPVELVLRCQSAAVDEREHTRRCFALASRYTGALVEPGRTRTGHPGAAPSLARLADESIRDGVLDEGTAALIASTQLDAAVDAEVSATLAVIARDEAAHAALGWAVLEWCAEVGGDEVRRAIAAAMVDVRVPRVPAAPSELSTAVADAHGRGVAGSLPALLAGLHADVVERLDAMLTRSPTAASSSRTAAAGGAGA